MRTLAIALTLACGLGASSPAPAADAPGPQTLDLWPAEAPGDAGAKFDPEKSETKDGITRVSNVTRPTLTVFRPDPAVDTGAAVVICPGGGYSILASVHEGDDVARFLNSVGVTGIVLKYRVPRRPGTPNGEAPPQALMDAQRAVGLVRARAAEWHLDPKRIGLLGFSAGGHLAAWAATNPGKRTYEPVDAADAVDCRPDFLVLIYPAYLLDKKDPAKLAAEIRADEKTPPSFLAHAADDPVTVESSVRLFSALRKAKVAAELHVYAEGGHGYGILPGPRPVATWPQRLADWMKARGLLEKPRPAA